MISKISFKIENEIETEIKEYCLKNNIPTVSDFMRLAIKDKLENKNTGDNDILRLIFLNSSASFKILADSENVNIKEIMKKVYAEYENICKQN